jgi:hypothetical protein
LCRYLRVFFSCLRSGTSFAQFRGFRLQVGCDLLFAFASLFFQNISCFKTLICAGVLDVRGGALPPMSALQSKATRAIAAAHEPEAKTKQSEQTRLNEKEQRMTGAVQAPAPGASATYPALPPGLAMQSLFRTLTNQIKFFAQQSVGVFFSQTLVFHLLLIYLFLLLVYL